MSPQDAFKQTFTMKKFTKIVATISDRRCDVEFIRALYENGLNVVRMNSAHLNREGFEKIINNVRAVSPSIGLMIDTKGPEIRTTINIDDKPIEFRQGDKVAFTGNPAGQTTHDNICLSYPYIANDVFPGSHFLRSSKSVNIPGVQISLPSVTERDKSNILLAIELGVDFIAHSFVRSEKDVQAVQEILDSHNSDIKIISKIENQEGVDNFDSILDASYGIMVARGDLGIEVPAEKIPAIQTEFIQKCILKHKPVIVATQMLHSMIENPPTPNRQRQIPHRGDLDNVARRRRSGEFACQPTAHPCLRAGNDIVPRTPGRSLNRSVRHKNNLHRQLHGQNGKIHIVVPGKIPHSGAVLYTVDGKASRTVLRSHRHLQRGHHIDQTLPASGFENDEQRQRPDTRRLNSISRKHLRRRTRNNIP